MISNSRNASEPRLPDQVTKVVYPMDQKQDQRSHQPPASQRFSEADLQQFAARVLVQTGFSEEDAAIVAESLVRADLENNSGHGISRLPIYVKRIAEGRIAARPDVRVEHAGNVLKVDGGNGLGHVVSMRALERAAAVAEQHGLAAAFIRGSNHFGTAAYYCQKMCERGMALLAMTNSPPGIAPWGGKQAFLGTNPIAFGFPVQDRPPVIIDMSSSVVARGKIILADKEGRSIPPGWALDADGRETTDPKAALQGSVMPLGGAKGYALAMAVEIMTAIMSGAAFGPNVNNLYKDGDGPADVGHAFVLFDLKRWLNMEQYFQYIYKFLNDIKQSPLASDAEHILYPGERREAAYRRNLERGIELSAEVQDELRRTGETHGVEFPQAKKG